MLDFAVLFVQRFTHAQTTGYTTGNPTVGFHARGLRYYRRPGLELDRPGPFLSLTPGGTPIKFAFGDDRENWVAALRSEHIRSTDKPNAVAVYDGEGWATLPAITPVPAEHVDGWIGEFELMREAAETPDATNRLRVQTGVADVLRYIIDRRPASHVGSPASELMRLIRQDTACRRSLAELSRQCGYSSDHLRILFVARYGVTPAAYRNRRRMAEALFLLGNSSLSIKEIASKTGFRHLSHFSKMFRDTFGVSASTFRRRQQDR